MAVAIIGTGAALPTRRVENRELEAVVCTTDDWIRSRTGIAERRMLAPGESLLALMESASRQALDAAGVAPAALDAILVGTVSAECSFPSAACELQARLGLDRIPSFDLGAACSGFIYGLSTASAHVRAGDWDRVLVVGADAITTMLDWHDRSTCILFGDGAGAVVLVRQEGERGVLATVTRASGALGDLLRAPVGSRGARGSGAEPPPESAFRMRGPETFKVAVRFMEEAVREVTERAGVALADVALFIPHQANVRIIDAVAGRLGAAPDRVFVNVERYGNTSAASIPIALHEAAAAGRIARGDLVVLAACGGGVTWGAAVVRW